METRIVDLLSSFTVGHVALAVGLYFVFKVAEWVLEDSARRREVDRWKEDK